MSSTFPKATLANWRQHPTSVWGFTHVDELIPIAPIASGGGGYQTTPWPREIVPGFWRISSPITGMIGFCTDLSRCDSVISTSPLHR